jgi:hypothetical protein
MKPKPSALAVALLVVVAAPGTAIAESAAVPVRTSGLDGGVTAEPKAPRALLTGMLIAGGSFGAGSWLLAGSGDQRRVHAGLAIGGVGLAIAPLFAHGAAGEWERGAWFTLPPALAGAAMAVLLREYPDAPLRGQRKSHSALLFPVLVGMTVAGSAVGIADAALVDERRRAGVRLTAHVSPDFTGLKLGGGW